MTDYARIQTELNALECVNGIVPADILNLPQEVAAIVRGMVRDKSLTAAQLAAALEIDDQQATALANTLIAKGYLHIVGDEGESEGRNETQDGTPNETPNETPDVPMYRIRFARMRRHNIPIDL